MNFSRGCDTVLSLMGPTTAPSSPSNSCCNSDGYHSDSDSEENYNELVQQYKSLYIKNRADALNALDALPQLKRGHHLKTKILFSIIVVRTRTLQFYQLGMVEAHIWSAAARGVGSPFSVIYLYWKESKTSRRYRCKRLHPQYNEKEIILIFLFSF